MLSRLVSWLGLIGIAKENCGTVTVAAAKTPNQVNRTTIRTRLYEYRCCDTLAGAAAYKLQPVLRSTSSTALSESVAF